MLLGLGILALFEQFDAAPSDDRDLQIVGHAQNLLVGIDFDVDWLPLRLEIKIFALAVEIQGFRLRVAFRMQGQFNRHLQVFDVLAHRATRAELAGARADYLIVDAEFRHARAFHPLREKVAHVLAHNLRCKSLEVIDRSTFVSILLEEFSQ